MEKEGFGEKFSICSAVFFWGHSGGHKKLKKVLFFEGIFVDANLAFKNMLYIGLAARNDKTSILESVNLLSDKIL